MKKTTIVGTTGIIANIIGSMMLSLILVPVSADAALGVSANASSSVNVMTKMDKAKDRANREIDRRVAALNKLNNRVGEMVKVSASEKASLSSSIQAQISILNALKIKIDADTDATVLTTDIKSITSSYRIFLLVIPQGAIIAAADRVETVADLMTTLSAKLQTRIAATSTIDASATTLLADMNAKVSAAAASAVAAQNEVSALVPDNGNATVQASNKAALLDARAKIKVSVTDLEAARADAKNIIKLLK